MEETPRLRACELLKSLEKLIIEHEGRIPAGKMALLHVRRAMELIGCSPKNPTIDERKLFEEKKVVVE